MNPIVQKAGFDTITGRLLRHLRRRRNGQCVNILTYHCVNPIEQCWTAGTSLRHDPAEFERHMDFVAEHFRPTRLSELADSLASGSTPERSVIVTLDDGTADALHFAAPILYRRRIPVTIFPVTSVIGNKDLLWPHKISWIEAGGHGGKLIAAMTACGNPPPADHETVGAYVRKCFRFDTPTLIESVLAQLGTSGPQLASKYRPYLECEDIAGADPDFVEFGNHTHTHPILSALDEPQQRAEIATAREALCSIKGHAPIAFAYPFGLARNYNAVSRRIAVETGHRAILDMRRRINHPGTSGLDLSRKPAPCGSQKAFEMILEDWPVNAGINP
jgi:peptidoglycan/xylan/chitin deacetylase (PgdA/CDA1 family)